MHDNMALSSGATLELIRILTKIWSICHFDMIPLTHLTTQVMIGEKPHCPNCCQQQLIPGGFLTSGVISFFSFCFVCSAVVSQFKWPVFFSHFRQSDDGPPIFSFIYC